jgi:hypothetical protein
LCSLALLSILSPLIQFSRAQESLDSSLTDTGDHIRVYLDCRSCDTDYIQTELTFVTYVRDRHNAQVHLLITTQRTGSGGREYSIAFLGQERFIGKNDTLLFAVKEFDSDALVRSEMVRILRLGLIQYVAETDLARRISISYQEDPVKSKVDDPWDFWVFEARMNAYLNGEKSRNSISLYGNLSASRTTAELKTGISVYGNYNANSFDVDGGTLSSFSRSKGGNASIIFSIDDHWSAGAEVGISSSTYQNRKSLVVLTPGLEYNIFPYSESTRRQLRVDLQTSYHYAAYEQETIYDKTHEHLFRNTLSLTLELKQAWGSVEISIEGSHYLHDFKKNRLRLSAETSLHLVEGLSLEVYGNFSMIHDQLSLPKFEASTEEVLLRRRELETQFDYYSSIGLSYTFGSIYSSVVNPRFGDF